MAGDDQRTLDELRDELSRSRDWADYLAAQVDNYEKGYPPVDQQLLDVQSKMILTLTGVYSHMVDVSRLLDSLDLCEGYSVSDADLPKVWQAIEIARTFLKENNLDQG